MGEISAASGAVTAPERGDGNEAEVVLAGESGTVQHRAVIANQVRQTVGESLNRAV